MPASIPRRIYFYRLKVVPDEDGRTRAFDVKSVFTDIGHLHFHEHTEANSRYMDAGHGHYLCVWPQVTSGKLRISLGISRRSGLPKLEESGHKSSINAKPNQGVVEETHVVFFQNGIVGVEFNFYGPRISRLADYFSQKLPHLPQIYFNGLISDDALKQLQNMEEIRLLCLRVRSDATDIFRAAARHLPGALRAASDQFDAPVVEVVFRAAPHSRRPLGQSVMDFLKSIVGVQSTRENAEILKARGVDKRTGEVEWFDFLRDKLVFVKRVAKENDRDRSVSSTDMFLQIEAAYNEQKEQLQEAVGIGS
jgi:hypothetical protein